MDEEEDTEEKTQDLEEKKIEVIQYKDYSKVFTPPKIALQLVEMAEIEEGNSILEPSAGLGIIIKAIHKKWFNLVVDYFELNENHNLQIFLSNDDIISRGTNFLQVRNIPKFDRIIANPPFDEDKWLVHIPKMYKCLAPNGILVSIMPTGLIDKETDPKLLLNFKNKVLELKAEFTPLPNWHTNKDGTQTKIQIVKIRKI